MFLLAAMLRGISSEFSFKVFLKSEGEMIDALKELGVILKADVLEMFVCAPYKHRNVCLCTL